MSSHTVAKVAVASAIGALAAFASASVCSTRSGTGAAAAFATLLLGALSAGSSVLAVVLWRMRISEIEDIVSLVRRR